MNQNPLSQSESLNPMFILVRGIPGGGKSYVTTKLHEALGQQNVVVVDPDAIDKTSDEYVNLSTSLTADGVDEKLHPYRFLRARAHQGIEDGKVVIWNQAFIDLDGVSKTIINLTTHAKEHGLELPILIVEVEIDDDVAKQRIADRVSRGGHNVPEEVMDRFIAQYRSFKDEDLNVVTVNGEDSSEVSVPKIINALENLSQ